MDANKLNVLRSVNYRIRACRFCVHADIAHGATWGVCRKHTYDHLKHSGNAHGLSIHAAGACDNFEASDDAASTVHGFAEFVK